MDLIETYVMIVQLFIYFYRHTQQQCPVIFFLLSFHQKSKINRNVCIIWCGMHATHTHTQWTYSNAIYFIWWIDKYYQDLNTKQTIHISSNILAGKQTTITTTKKLARLKHKMKLLFLCIVQIKQRVSLI